MRNTKNVVIYERGQILPLVVFGVLAIIILSVLVIDGGVLLSNRRTAQAAADAGALAGAKMICLKKSESIVTSTAIDYAVNKNGASSATANMTSDGQVEVIAEMQQDSFFARVLGEDTLTTTARAVAGCFAPEGNYTMPIAWSCRPPVGGTVFDPDLGCKMVALDWPNLLGPLVGGQVSTIEIDGKNYKMRGDDIVDVATEKYPAPQIYIIMDKQTVTSETLCKEDLAPTDPAYSTAIVCDLDGDGKNDIEGAGNRGWLDLNNGGGGTADMRTWIRDGLDFHLPTHIWRSGEPGTTPPVYWDVKQYRQGQVVLIPVFNAICDDSTPLDNEACMTAAHTYPWEPEPATGDIDEQGHAPKFHIISFDAFYISCVRDGAAGHGAQECPGFAWAQEQNPDPKHPKKSLIGDNVPSIEGYFLTNYELPLDTEVACDVNLGNCKASLTE